MKLLVTLALAVLLAVPAEAQRGRRGGKRGGGGRRGKNNAGAKKAAKAQKAAEAQAKQQLQKKNAQLKEWVAQRKAQAKNREQTLLARGRAEAAADPGPMFRKHCAGCHTTPDPSFGTDGAWLRRLDETRCRELPDKLAHEMRQFLAQSAQFRPQAITTHAEPGPGSASVRSDIEGELFLRSDSGTDYRLQWGPDQAGEKRVLAPGRYSLSSYRLTRGPWIVSSSGGDRPVLLKPDGSLELRVPRTLRIELTASPGSPAGRPNGALLRFALRDLYGNAVTVYRDGQRIPLPFQVETKAGSSQHGLMAYVEEGRAEANVTVPLGDPAFARVDLPLGLPFPLEGQPRTPLPPAR